MDEEDAVALEYEPGVAQLLLVLQPVNAEKYIEIARVFICGASAARTSTGKQHEHLR